MKRIMFAATTAAAMGLANAAAAGDLNNVGSLSQEDFGKLSQDLASLNAPRNLSSGIPLGLVGAEVGVEVGVSDIEHSDIWQRAGGGSSDVISPRVTAYKGLMAGLDIGASLGKIGSSGISTIGGMVRYAVVEPGTVAPGVTLRFAASREFGSDTIRLRSYGADVVVAKPLAIITPYAGIGTSHSNVRAGGTSLSDVSVNRSRIFAGFDTKVALGTFSLEADKTGDVTSIAAKFGVRF